MKEPQAVGELFSAHLHGRIISTTEFVRMGEKVAHLLASAMEHFLRVSAVYIDLKSEGMEFQQDSSTPNPIGGRIEQERVSVYAR
mmetsp:Transcript_7271/g.17109  ORF Transcript_7271/g.17109 Transcript_7271/m.17109 type:complete len:85 (+) Transcript_7271:1388-1642(+)